MDYYRFRNNYKSDNYIKGNIEKNYIIPKIDQKSLRAITLQGAIVKSTILLSKHLEKLTLHHMFLHLVCTNKIFADFIL